jgi:hypothetical protein
MACFPALAQAEATGAQYEPEVPTVPSEQSPGGGTHHGGTGVGAGTSNAPGENGAGGGKGSGAGGGPHNGQSSQGPEGKGGQGQGGQNNPGGGGVVQNKPVANPGPGSSKSGEEGSSSPLVPILIAIVVLAAISIGAYYYRQRRQGDAGSSVSPKAS